jgi:thiosulfate reductase/polysulfide reductase chain A
MAQEMKNAVCEWCHAKCRVLVHSEDGRLVKVEPDRSYPLWDKISPPVAACLRLHTIREFMGHPDRVHLPLKRAGERGEGKWQTISWDQAFDEIAERLSQLKEKYGAETVASQNGTQRTMEWVIGRFLNVFGSPNYMGANSICHNPCINPGAALLGWPPRHRTQLYIESGAGGRPKTGCVLLLGINPRHSRLRMWPSLRDAKKLGIKLIVVDPRRTETAELADIWLQLRPGTDAALLMSMINVIIEEELYHKEFVDNWCHGLAELRERAREYPPEKVAEITWLPAEKIREAARVYAQNRPAMTTNGMGTEQLSTSIEAIHAKFILSMLTGSIDVDGGDYMTGPARCHIESELDLSEKLSPEQKKKQIGTDRFKLLGWPGRDAIMPHVLRVWGKKFSVDRGSATAHAPSIYRAMITGKPYPVKALIHLASNAMITGGNVKLIYKALKSVEFHVVLDHWLTPSAELADYVLPVTPWMERPYLGTLMATDNTIRGGEKALPSAIAGEFDHRTDYDIMRGISLKLGLGEYWPWEDLEQVFDWQLEPLGITFKEFMAQGGYEDPPKEFQKYKRIGFGTPTGKAELYSTIFEQLGYDPLPYYEESHENPLTKPELAQEYPLMLITGGRIQPYFHSEFRQFESIRRKRPHPVVQIHPETAAESGINSGDWVWIESPRGRIRMKCELFKGIDPRVVHAEHGWWFPELPGEEPWLHGVWESNVNVLTDDDPDVCNKLSGGWPLKTALCKIYPCKVY